jgi:hypothetical protein
MAHFNNPNILEHIKLQKILMLIRIILYNHFSTLLLN